MNKKFQNNTAAKLKVCLPAWRLSPTKELLIRPSGVIDASFNALENNSGKDGPKLHFNTKK